MPEMSDELIAAEDQRWMERALVLARQAAANGEVPVGAVLVRDGVEIGTGSNSPISQCDPTAHAEIRAIRDAASRFGNYRLPGSTLYVTLEPCTMCAGALVHARISRLVFGAREPKAGVIVSTRRALDDTFLNWRVAVTEGILADACSRELTNFFAAQRSRQKQEMKS